MAGLTGYTPITNASAMLGPAQITGVFEHFDALVPTQAATSAALPSTGNWPGRRAFIEDTKTNAVWDGAAWIRFDTQWISYTPTRVNNSGGTLTAKYFRTGKKVDVIIRLVGGTIVAPGNPSFSLPFAAGNADVQWLPGTVLMLDSSASAEILGIVRRSSSSTVVPYSIRSDGTFSSFASLGAATPFTWAASDVLELAFSYEIP